jgi:hypothetical protein
MRLALIAILGMLLFGAVATAVQADVSVNGYYRSSGTYVAPHYRSNPDGNFYNNWSTYPNVNPYTGSVGTRYYPTYRPLPLTPSYTPRYIMPYRGK